ncbi:MAG: DUF4870 domain-containing protein [Cyanobacteria bacterium P01_E01_bin.6]
MQPTQAYDSDKRKLLSALCHGSIFLSTLFLSISIPIGILFVSDDPVVKANAKEAINFHFNVWFWGIVIVILSIITLGLLVFILGPIGYALHWGLTIWAITHSFSKPDTSFRYPFIVRLV